MKQSTNKQSPSSGCRYCPPRVLSLLVAPDLTKCMQNTGGTEERSTFRQYRKRFASGLHTNWRTRGHGSSLTIVFLALALTASIVPLRASADTPTQIPVLIPQRHKVVLDIVDGINQELKDRGYARDGVPTILLDGQGVTANYSTIVDAALQKRPPVLIAITTLLSKIAVDKANGSVPVVFSGVTDPVGAAIVPDLVKHGPVTGASDLWPIEEQLRLIRRVVPTAKAVGVIFRPSEPNSQFGMRVARDAAKRLNIILVERGVEDPNQVVPVLEAILSQVDAIYVGPDNMTIEAAKAIVESSAQAGKPVFGGESTTLEKGAIGVVSIDYRELGRETARLCDRIIKGSPTETIPVYVASQGFVGLNYDTAQRLGLSIPEDVRRDARTTIGVAPPASTTLRSVIVGLTLIVVCILVLAWFRTRRTRTGVGQSQS